MSPRAKRAWLLAGALAVAVVALDQLAKALVEANLVTGERVDVLGPLELMLSHNSGVAFGLASGGGEVLILFSVAALGVVGYLFARDPARPGMWVAVGLLAGGALGNLIDRVLEGAVTDYVDFLAWPPFNLADVAIVAGVLLLALLYLAQPQGASDDG